MKLVMQFIKFGIVGISNVIVSYGVYLLLTFWGINYIIANIVSFLCGNINSFIWNNKLVFTNTKKHKLIQVYFKQLWTNAFTGVVVNNILLYILVTYLGIDKIYAPLLILIITVPINFWLSKFWVYK